MWEQRDNRVEKKVNFEKRRPKRDWKSRFYKSKSSLGPNGWNEPNKRAYKNNMWKTESEKAEKTQKERQAKRANRKKKRSGAGADSKKNGVRTNGQKVKKMVNWKKDQRGTESPGFIKVKVV